MQLNVRQSSGLLEKLALVSASLLAATMAGTPSNAQSTAGDSTGSANFEGFGPGTSYTQFDSALLVYQETGGRVMAIEPSASLVGHGAQGQEISFGLIADAVSGATPNGAAPANTVQTFVTPIKAQGSSTTVTGASGGSTIIHIPPTPGQIAQAALGRQYLAAPNTLPVDKGFKDHRGAFSFGWSQPVGGISEVGFGGSYSREQDYQSITSNVSVAQNFNSNNTTLNLSLNTELDSSFPYGGVPTPFSQMSPDWKKTSTKQKTQLGFVFGITQILTRRWITQLNYSFDAQSGYLNDPYRILSLVDPVTGEPNSYLYEKRPDQRTTQSIFWDNKIDFDPAITELSFRYFKDNWGITSKTAELSERFNIGRSFYLEPNVRWYQQSAANFYHPYLVAGGSLPPYATSDYRLGKFQALTYGAKIGVDVTNRSEIYVSAEYYQQTGNSHPAGAIGQLAQQDLFPATKAAVVFVGYTWDFH